MYQTKRSFYGFTLIEMLLVILIIVILAGLLLPAIGSAREKGRLIACANNLRQIGIGMMSYAGDYGNHLPNAWSCTFNGGAATWDSYLATNGYASASTFHCSDDRVVRTGGGMPRSYAIGAGGGSSPPGLADYCIQGTRLTCPYLTNSSTIAIATERYSSTTSIIGMNDSTAYFNDSNTVTSAHVNMKPPYAYSCNYLFMDFHAVWVASTGSSMFPGKGCSMPSGIPCCQ